MEFKFEYLFLYILERERESYYQQDFLAHGDYNIARFSWGSGMRVGPGSVAPWLARGPPN